MKILLILAALALPAAAWADCGEVWLDTPPQLSLALEPFGDAPFALQGRLRLRGGGEGCQAVLRVAPADGAVWRLVGSAGSLAVRPRLGSTEASGSQPLVADVALTGDERDADFTLLIVTPQYAEPGLYDLLIEAQVTERGGERVLVGPQLLRTSVEVLPQAQVNIAGGASSFGAMAITRVVFSQSTAGAQERAFIQLRANTQSIITVRSENQGRLVADDDPSRSLAYAADIDGVRGDLSNLLQVSRRPLPNLAGSSFPLTLTLLEDGAFAGRYSDIILIDVIPE